MISIGYNDARNMYQGFLIRKHKRLLEDGKKESEEYFLLGPIEFELDLYPMIVTYHSPFGQAMVGKKLNEDFTLEIGDKDIKFTITAIDKISS